MSAHRRTTGRGSAAWLALAALAALGGASCSAGRDASEAEDRRVMEEHLEDLQERARDGDVAAQVDVAARRYHGIGLAEDRRAAALWYTRAAEAGDAEAQFSLGLMLENGDGVPVAPTRAADWYARAAKQGDVRAQTNLGLMLATGSGIPRDAVGARQYLGAAAELGHAPAQLAYGTLLAEGTGGPVDTRAGVEWIRRAAESGLVEAQRALSMAYARGVGVQMDAQESRRWLERAADRGDPQAALLVARDLLESEDDADLARAVSLLERAAAKDLPEAMFNLALLHLRGRGVPEDGAAAREWLERAAALGDERSTAALANLDGTAEADR